jgi:ribosomal protein S18 acetylase RimI-like enzyme
MTDATHSRFTLRQAIAADGEDMIALLPQLAAFVLPPKREPEHLWHGDREMVHDWLAGNRPQCFAIAAVADDGYLGGYAFVSMREELLSHAPSAHLEVLVVAGHVRRAGLGARLCAAVEVEAKNRGAESMTLHVFGNNERARALYAKIGYDEELIRAIKHL